ncbi:MAG: 2-hydroxyacyl-CoA dehydratase [Candidatus Abyssobacteria bacterium SURF_5]|uniref:2-hydroxyacyl-CoA dehydratase n=1 Tax=Abyssobacteria bacterium (strain SURF_5) TaxID=2093360 RepID=A0A3A4NBU2_ABYX5|nr:MAG: 2-hydroxyacyl-CoA dehydratase [Candidatus Abyssubacteria bacterium SURF_5]
MGSRMHAKKHLETTKAASALIKSYYEDQRRKQNMEGQPVAWCCVGIPKQLLQALDILAFYPEQYATVCASRDASSRFIKPAEAAGFAKELCGYARVNLGFIMEGLPEDAPMGGMPRPDFLLITSIVCDTRIKWFELMADMLGVPVYLMEVPQMPPAGRNGADGSTIATENAGIQVGREDAPHLEAYVMAQYQGLVEFLEKQTGRSLDPQKLFEIQQASRRVGKLRREINEYRKHIPTPMGAGDAFTAMFPGMYMPGTKEADAFYEQLRAEVKQRIETKTGIVDPERFRLAWSGIPFWYNMGLINYFEEKGGVVVIDTQYGSAASTINTATRQPQRWGMNGMVGSVIRAVVDYNIDGVILSYTPTCRALYINQMEIKNSLEEELGVPALLLESDMVDPSSFNEGQTITRIDAFIELVSEKAKSRNWA